VRRQSSTKLIWVEKERNELPPKISIFPLSVVEQDKSEPVPSSNENESSVTLPKYSIDAVSYKSLIGLDCTNNNKIRYHETYKKT